MPNTPLATRPSSEILPFRKRVTAISTLATLLLFNLLARFIRDPLLLKLEVDLGLPTPAPAPCFFSLRRATFVGGGLQNLVIAPIMPFAMLTGGGAFPTF